MDCERRKQIQKYIHDIPKMLQKKRALEKARYSKQSGKKRRIPAGQRPSQVLTPVACQQRSRSHVK